MKSILFVFSVLNIYSSSKDALVCGSQDELARRIFGGDDAVPGMHPYMAAIMNKETSFVICGGAILTQYLILTAAHCFYDGTYMSRLDNYLVGAGQTQSGAFTDTRLIARVVIHNGFNPSKNEPFQDKDNVAILKVQNPFHFNYYVQPILLSKDDAQQNDTCLIMGWGVKPDTVDKSVVAPYIKAPDERSETVNIGWLPSWMQVANVTIFDGQKCATSYYMYNMERTGKASHMFMPQSMICAGSRNGAVDACKGDSGSPLVCNNRVQGIATYNVGCKNNDLPAGYTNVHYYHSWISDTVKKLCANKHESYHELYNDIRFL